MPHPTPQNFVQAVVMVLQEYVEESQHSLGEGAPYESFDQIDGLGKLLKDFGFYLGHRGYWNDNRDNPLLTDKLTTGIVLNMLTPTPSPEDGKLKISYSGD